jgi:aspartate ammonia-lyase
LDLRDYGRVIARRWKLVAACVAVAIGLAVVWTISQTPIYTATAEIRHRTLAPALLARPGRTHLQDAVPMTVGQEFYAFASSLEGEIQNIRQAEKALYTINMGATAIGTGINVPKGYAEKCAVQLAKLTGKPIVVADDMLAATWDQQGFVVYSSALKSVAIKLAKIASDLILLAGEPHTIGEVAEYEHSRYG